MAPTKNSNNKRGSNEIVEKTSTATNKVKKVKSSTTSTNDQQQLKIQNNIEIIKDIIEQYFNRQQHTITKEIELTILQLIHHNQCLCKVLNEKENNKLTLKWVQSLTAMIRNKKQDTANNNQLEDGSSTSEKYSCFALTLLIETIRIANYDLMIENQNQWCTLLVEVANDSIKKKQEEKYRLSMIAMSILIEKSALWNDTRRSITSSNTINQFINCATASFSSPTSSQQQQQQQLSSMIAICSFIDSLDASIKPFVGRLEVLSYALMFGSDSLLSDAATSLISRLPKCIGITSSDMYWSVSLNKIITTMDIAIDRLFKGIPSDKNNLHSRTVSLPKNVVTGAIEGNDQLSAHLTHLISIPTPSLSTTPSQIYEQETRSFQNLTSCLIKMLTTSTITSCQLPLDRIIKLISRILNIGFNQLSSNPHNDFTIIQQVSIITKLHCSCYQLLAILFKVLRKSMIPFTKTISLALLKPLKMMESYSNLNIQKELYSTIQVVFESIGASCCDTLAIPLIPILLKQLIPYIPDQQQQQQQVQEKKSKKKGKDHQPEAIMTGPIQQQTIGNVDATKIWDKSDHQLRVAALQVLQTILLNSGSFLGTNLRTQIDSAIISLVMHCQTLSLKKVIFINSSYQCDSYRSLLYGCLVNLAIKPISGIPPVLPYAVRLLTNASTNDISPQVRSTCIQGVSICESIIHPQCPNLQAPLIHSNLNSLKKSINQQQQQQQQQNTFFNNIQQQDQVEEQEDEIEEQVEEQEEVEEVEESNSEEEEDDDDEKLDISLNDINDDDEEEEEEDDDDEDDDKEEEENKNVSNKNNNNGKLPTTAMKSGLFNDLSFNVSNNNNNNNNKAKIKDNKKQHQQKDEDEEDDDDDLDFDIVDEPPSDD